jgi:TP901 family phage tail tape measure protein
MPIGNEANLRITATDKASAKIKKVGKNAKGLGGQLGGINKMFGGMAKTGPLAALAVGAAVGTTSVKLSRMAKEFDKSFTQVMTLLPGTSKRVFDGMKNDIKGLSKELGVDLVDATTGLYNALSAGVPQKNVLSFMETASKAAIAGGSDLTTTVTTLAQVMNVYGVGVEEAEDISNKMFTTVKLGMTTLPELSASIANVLPVAQSLGVSFGETSSMLAVLTASTGQTAESITRLRSLFTAASKDTSVLSKAIKSELGDSFANLIGKGRTTSEIMQDLRDRMPLEEFRNLFRRTEAQAAALLITGENAVKVADAYDQMTMSIGATSEAFRVVDESMSQSWDKATTNLKTVGIELGEKILPIVVDFLEAVVTIVDKVGDFVEWIGAISVSPSERGGPTIQTGPMAGMQMMREETITGTGKQAAGGGREGAERFGMTKAYYDAWSGQFAYDAERLGFRDITKALSESEAQRIEMMRVGRMTDQGPGTIAGMVGGMAYGLAPESHGARLRQEQFFKTRDRGPGFQGLGANQIELDIDALLNLATEQKAKADRIAAKAAAELTEAMRPLSEQTVIQTSAMLDDTNKLMERAGLLGYEIDIQKIYNDMLEDSADDLANLREALEAAQEAGGDYSEELEAYNERLSELGIDWQNEVAEAIQDLEDETERQFEEAQREAKKAAQAEEKRMRDLIAVNKIQASMMGKSMEEIVAGGNLAGLTTEQVNTIFQASQMLAMKGEERNVLLGVSAIQAAVNPKSYEEQKKQDMVWDEVAQKFVAKAGMVMLTGMGDIGLGGLGVKALKGQVGTVGIHRTPGEGGITYEITVEGNVYTSEDSGRAIVESINAYAVSQGQTSAEVLNAENATP